MTAQAKLRGEVANYTALQLKQRLHHLNDDVARLYNHAFAAPRAIDLGSNADEATRWMLHYAASARHNDWYILEGSHQEVGVSITVDRCQKSVGERIWSDYTGDARLLAWSLAHEHFVAQLGHLLGDELQVQRAVTSRPPNLRAVTIGFELTGSLGNLRGVLALAPSGLEVLIHQPEWQTVAATQPSGKPNVPIFIQIGLRPINLPHHVLREHRVGDVLLLDLSVNCWEGLHLSTVGTGGTWQWRARYTDGKVEVLGPIRSRRNPSSQDAQESEMADDNPASPPPESTGGPTNPDQAAEDMPSPGEMPGSIDQVPVGLTFDLGRLEIGLAELESVQPGYVFQLDQPLESTAVRVRANGLTIAKGELVVVGEQLGIRLTEFMGSDSR